MIKACWFSFRFLPNARFRSSIPPSSEQSVHRSMNVGSQPHFSFVAMCSDSFMWMIPLSSDYVSVKA